MTKKAFTTFGAGPSGVEALRRPMAAVPATVTNAVEVGVPADANPSKFATWIQRAAIDGVVADEVPSEYRDDVERWAAVLDDVKNAVAIDMSGNPAGEKMRERLGCGVDDRPWLLFGLTEHDGA